MVSLRIGSVRLDIKSARIWFARDEFLRQSTIMFLASTISSVCNYIYQIYVGRSLGPEGYGSFGSLFAIFYLVYVFSGTFQAGSAQFTSRFKASGETENVGAFINGLIKRTAILGMVGFFVFVIFSAKIAEFLKIDPINDVIVLGTAILFSFLLPPTSGAIQGLQDFSSLALVSILTFMPKLIFGVILVSLGYGISGALGAVTLGLATAFLFTLNALKSYLKNGQKNDMVDFRDLYFYSIPTILIMICLAVPSNVDVILAKHFFTSHEAGLYTAVSVLGKIVLFLPSAIYVVMFPKASEMRALGQSPMALLNKSLIITGVLAGAAAAIFILVPQLVERIFGTGYIEASPIIKFYATMMFFFSLTWVVAQYCMATNRLKYVYIIFFFTSIEIALMSLVHGSVLQMVTMLLVVNVVFFFTSYVYAIHKGRGSCISCQS